MKTIRAYEETRAPYGCDTVEFPYITENGMQTITVTRYNGEAYTDVPYLNMRVMWTDSRPLGESLRRKVGTWRYRVGSWVAGVENFE